MLLLRSIADKFTVLIGSNGPSQCACGDEHARTPHMLLAWHTGHRSKLRRSHGPALTPRLTLACQVWRALCKPLNQEVAVKLVNLERQDVDLVRTRLEGHDGCF